MNGVDLWGSIPCNPWSSWQRLNWRRLGPEFRRRLMAQRLESKKLLRFFFQLAENHPENVELGFISSGPQDALVGSCRKLQDFFNSNHFVGGDSFKPWTVASTDDSLIRCLRTKTCSHDHKHVPLCGSKTPNSAFYPTQWEEQSCHRCSPTCSTNLSLAWAACQQLKSQCTFQKKLSLKQIPLGIHELIDKKVWKSDPAAVNEAKKEAQGLIEAGTWDYKHVIQRHDLERQARQSGTKVAIGRLMTIMSWKNAESAEEKRLKARIVFLGNNVRDEFGLASEFQSQSDVIKAYIQRDLQTENDTYIELPEELAPGHLKWMHRPCTKLHKSLYGHPESGGHWGFEV